MCDGKFAVLRPVQKGRNKKGRKNKSKLLTPVWKYRSGCAMWNASWAIALRTSAAVMGHDSATIFECGETFAAFSAGVFNRGGQEGGRTQPQLLEQMREHTDLERSYRKDGGAAESENARHLPTYLPDCLPTLRPTATGNSAVEKTNTSLVCGHAYVPALCPYTRLMST